MPGSHPASSPAAAPRRRSALIALLAAFALLATLLTSPAAAEEEVREFPNPEEFVIQQYLDFLARSPDAGGLNFWAGELRRGVDPGALVESLVGAPEFADVIAPVVRLYYAYFGRSPDFDGLVFWSGFFRDGNDLDRISSQFVASNEFIRTYGSLSDAQFIDRVYLNVLERRADGGGQTFWRSQLAGGLSRGEMMVRFSESPEYKTKLDGVVRATMLYTGMLRREPERNGLSFWAGELDSGRPYRDAINGFIQSSEYAERIQGLFPEIRPLTGERARSLEGRPVLPAKIGNSQSARPQFGINQADLVYEILVEGAISRFLAVYHEQLPPSVGPIRSVRTSDFDVFSQFNFPLVAASGANARVRELLQGYPVVSMTALDAESYFRTNSRRAPYNLIGQPAGLLAEAPNADGRPGALLRYRSPFTNPSQGAAGAGVDIDFGNTDVSYRWNGGSYDRTQNGTAHVDANGVRVSPQNVVVMVVNYEPSIADRESPHAITVGSGDAFIYTGGNVIRATWSRDLPTDRIVYRAKSNGDEVLLTPGRTWIAVAPPASVRLR